jgi:hypothetical protein
MAGNEAQIIGVELERVDPKVPTLFEREDVFYSTIEKRPVEIISGRDMRVPLEIRAGGKFGFYNPDGGDLGRGDMTTFDKAIINTVNMKFAVEWTSKSMWGTDDKRRAVIDTFKHNLAMGMKELRRHVDSQCMTDGTSTLATITSIVTANGSDTYTLTTDGFAARLLRYGQDINIFSSNLQTRRVVPTTTGETTITFWDLANKTITVTPSVTGVSVGDIIVASGLTSDNPQGLYGVKYHDNNASTGAWLGFDRSQNPEIRSNRVAGNSAAITLPLARLCVNKIGDRAGKTTRKGFKAWCHPAQEAALEELGMNSMWINKTAKEEDLNLYFNDNITIAGAPLNTSYSWDRTRIDFIDQETWGRCELHPAGFYKNPDNGQRLWEVRGPSGGVATTFVFYIVASFNLYTNNPVRTGYIDTLAVPPGY